MRTKALGTAMLIALTALFTMTGCGSSGDTYSVYDGSVAEATVVGDDEGITQEIVDAFDDEALQSVAIHYNLAGVPLSLLGGKSSSALAEKAPVPLANNLFAIASVADTTKETSTVQTVSTTVAGYDDQGLVTIEGSLDVATYTGIITYDFEDFVPGSSAPAIDGVLVMNIAPAADFTELVPTLLYTMTWRNLTATDGDEVTVFAGTIIIRALMETGPLSIESNLSYTAPDGSGTTYLDNTTWTYDNDADTVSVSGRLYNSERGGYLTVEGSFNCSRGFIDLLYPTDGTITLTGANGGVVELTYASEAFTIRIDADGDGTFEYPETI